MSLSIIPIDPPETVDITTKTLTEISIRDSDGVATLVMSYTMGNANGYSENIVVRKPFVGTFTQNQYNNFIAKCIE